jgi:hypothetical protein
MVSRPEGPSNLCVKRKVLRQGVNHFASPRIVVLAKNLPEIPEDLGSVFPEVHRVNMTFTHLLLEPIDKELAKFGCVLVLFQSDEVPDPIGETALQSPAQLRPTHFHG